MTVNGSGFKSAILFLKEVAAGIGRGINNWKKHIDNQRLARYAVEELGKKDNHYRKGYFAVPTVENTSVLRDYVHHKLTKKHLSLEKVDKARKPSLLQVLIWLEEKKCRVQCGGLANILSGIYQGLGYSAVLCDWVDMEPSYYTDSHTLVEVYIPDPGKYIIQDPSYNMMVNHNNTPVNTLELMSLLRNSNILENKEITFVNNMDNEVITI